MKKGQVTAKSLETRESILRAALALFQANGFDKTTMRDIAQATGLSVGSTYYYFSTKDEMVLAFYKQIQNETAKHTTDIVAHQTDFKKRLEELFQFKLQQMTPYRSFVGVLVRSAADAKNPLSPFSPQTKEVRDEAIGLFASIIEGSNLKVARSLAPYLPRLLWFYLMGIMFFWIHDSSGHQRKTEQLLEHSIRIIMRLIRISAFPLLRPVNQSVVNLLKMLQDDEVPNLS